MFQIFIVMLVVLSSGATAVAVANGAKPGDLLYPLDRSLENLHISLVSEEKKVELHLDHAQERLEEIQESIDDPDANEYRETSLDTIRRLEETGAELLAQGNTQAADEIDRVVQEIQALTQESFEIDQAEVTTTEDGMVETVIEATQSSGDDEESEVTIDASLRSSDGTVSEHVTSSDNVSIQKDTENGTLTIASDDGVTTIHAATHSSDDGNASASVSTHVNSESSQNVTIIKKNTYSSETN